MDMKDTFRSFKDTGLQQETFHEDMTWDEYVQELSKLTGDDKKLKQLIRIKQTEEVVAEASLDNIMLSNFENAKNIINQMTMTKRIAMLEEIDDYRGLLYDSLNRYGNAELPRDEQLSATEFRAILGRIKHLEILMNWLFGIV